MFQTRPQNGCDPRCVFEESENMIPQVSTRHFFLMMLFLPQVLRNGGKKNVSEEASSSQPGERREKKKKTFTDRSYSLFPLLNAIKTFCSATACCCLRFWSGDAALNCSAVPGARQQLSISGLHLGHVSKHLVIAGRRSSDTTTQTLRCWSLNQESNDTLSSTDQTVMMLVSREDDQCHWIENSTELSFKTSTKEKLLNCEGYWGQKLQD